MQNETYKAFETLKWWSNFQGKNILIRTKVTEYDIAISNNMICHLLGLHYMKLEKPLSSGKLFYYVLEQKLSDSQILKLVSKNSYYKTNDVSNRIHYFR